MKITLAIPKSKKFDVEQEINEARNIQSKSDRESTIEGLRAIQRQYSDGRVYLWNGSELTTYDYPSEDFIYHCDKTYFVTIPSQITSNKYLMLVVDGKQATIGLLEGSGKKTVLWSGNSGIMGKHNGGGQSKDRFRRQHEGLTKAWYRKIADKLKNFYYRGKE